MSTLWQSCYSNERTKIKMAKSKKAAPVETLVAVETVMPTLVVAKVQAVEVVLPVVVYPSLRQASKLNSEFDAWTVAGVSYQDTTDDLLFQAIQHFHTYGDTVFMNRAINGANKGARKQTMLTWFAKYSPCKWVESEKVFKKNKSNGVPLFMDNNADGIVVLNAAYANPYHFEREITKKDFTKESFLKALDAVSKRYVEAKAEDRIEGDIETLDSLNVKVLAFRKTLAIAA